MTNTRGQPPHVSVASSAVSQRAYQVLILHTGGSEKFVITQIKGFINIQHQAFYHD